MASIRKHGKGWQAQIAKAGVRRSRKFPTKREAQDWAAREEHLISEGAGRYGPGTLADLFRRYAKEVSPQKRGARYEQLRLERIAKDPLGAIAVKDARPGDFADWRDRRLTEVKPASVLREMQILSAVMIRAQKEWGVIPTNPLRDVQRPKPPPHRDRRVSADEIAMLRAAARSPAERMAVMSFEFAIETGMRQGEIARLRRADITDSVARLTQTKNGHPRDVPLSSAALAILAQLPDDLFGLEAASIDVHFRRVRDRTPIENLTYHDSRHEAITRMARKLDVLALARVVGHRDVRQLSIYYNESAADLAKRLG